MFFEGPLHTQRDFALERFPNLSEFQTEHSLPLFGKYMQSHPANKQNP